MKILLAAGLFPPDIGGPATYAELVATELPKRGIEVVVVPYRSVRTIPKVFRHLAYARLLWRSSRDVQVIFALDGMSVGMPARIIARLRRIPFVVRLGGDYVWEQGVQRFGIFDTLDVYTARTSSRPLVVRVLARVQTWVTRGAAAVILPSKYLEQIVRTWEIDPARTHVVYSAVTPCHVSDTRADIRAEYGLTSPLLVSVARLTPWKGFRTLIDVVARRVAQGDVTTLVIGGDGPDRAALEQYARERDVSEYIRFTGALSHDEVFRYIKAADIFLLNTAYEGLSHQLQEVMSIGAPIITTPIGGNPELITDGTEGLLVPVDDVAGFDAAIDRLLSDADLCDTMTAAGHERLTHFSTETSMRTLVTLLESVV
jgi:glycosyltransferase involved in cell wall biosynthesis